MWEGWVGGWRWMGLKTTSLELHCINYSKGKRKHFLFVLPVVILNNRVIKVKLRIQSNKTTLWINC